MSQVETSLQNVREAWDTREDDPIRAADLLAKRYQTEDLTPYRLSLEIGARVAEVSVFLDLAELDSRVKHALIEEDLPLSLATDLIKEDEDVQVELMDLLLETKDETEDVQALFEKVAEDYYEDRGVNASTVSGDAMMHLSGKAKDYNALSKRRRSAIFSIGRTKSSQGYSNLSTKQIRYVNDILKELKDEDILTASCSTEDCEHCNAIADLLEGPD